MGIYFIEIVFTIKPYLFSDKANRSKNKELILKKEMLNTKYAKDHPYSIKNFSNGDLLLDYFRDKDKNAYNKFSPGAQGVIDNNGFKYGENERLYPFSTVSKARIVFCGESGFWVNYVSDRFGFRNEDSIWNKKDIDAVFIGDSFTHGACVDDTDTFSGIANSSGINSINLGMGGTGSLIQLAALKEYIVNNRIKPKFIIWVYYSSDFGDNFNEYKSSILRSYLEDSTYKQDLVKKNKLKDILIAREHDNYLKTSKVKNIKNDKQLTKIKLFSKELIKNIKTTIRLIQVRYAIMNLLNIETPEINSEEKIDIFQKTLTRLKEEAKSLNSKIIFVYLPSWYEFHHIDGNGSNSRHPNYRKRREILDMVKKNNIPIINTRNLLLKNGKEGAKAFYNFNLYGHFNPVGYKKVGEYILENLEIYK